MLMAAHAPSSNTHRLSTMEQFSEQIRKDSTAILMVAKKLVEVTLASGEANHGAFVEQVKQAVAATKDFVELVQANAENVVTEISEEGEEVSSTSLVTSSEAVRASMLELIRLSKEAFKQGTAARSPTLEEQCRGLLYDLALAVKGVAKISKALNRTKHSPSSIHTNGASLTAGAHLPSLSVGARLSGSLLEEELHRRLREEEERLEREKQRIREQAEAIERQKRTLEEEKRRLEAERKHHPLSPSATSVDLDNLLARELEKVKDRRKPESSPGSPSLSRRSSESLLSTTAVHSAEPAPTSSTSPRASLSLPGSPLSSTLSEPTLPLPKSSRTPPAPRSRSGRHLTHNENRGSLIIQQLSSLTSDDAASSEHGLLAVSQEAALSIVKVVNAVKAGDKDTFLDEATQAGLRFNKLLALGRTAGLEAEAEALRASTVKFIASAGEALKTLKLNAMDADKTAVAVAIRNMVMAYKLAVSADSAAPSTSSATPVPVTEDPAAAAVAVPIATPLPAPITAPSPAITTNAPPEPAPTTLSAIPTLQHLRSRVNRLSMPFTMKQMNEGLHAESAKDANGTPAVGSPNPLPKWKHAVTRNNRTGSVESEPASREAATPDGGAALANGDANAGEATVADTADKAQERERKRLEVLKELLATERTYVQSLEVMVKVFIDPLREIAASPNGFITEKAIASVFGNVETIVHLNIRFLDELEKRLNNWQKESQTFGDFFVNDMGSIMNLYSEYISKYDRGMAALDQMESDPRFQEFLAERRKVTGLQKLPSYLILPVQRLPRYELLFEQLLKYTADNHPDHPKIALALEKVKEVNRFIDERKHEEDNRNKLIAIQKQITGQSLFLVVQGRKYIREGQLEEVRSTKKAKGGRGKSYFYFMFNDILVKTQKKEKASMYEYKDFISWSGVTINEAAESKDERSACMFQLVVPATDSKAQTTYTFYASSEYEKKAWVKDVKTVLAEYEAGKVSIEWI